MRENYNRAVISWKLTGKRPRDHDPKRRWMDVAGEDLKKIGVNDWRNIIYDQEKRREVVIATKHLYSRSNLKKKNKKYSIDYKVVTCII